LGHVVFPAKRLLFARMSKMVYSKKSDVQGMLTGNETIAGLGFDRFHWFEA
ncbi:unnamed protein product, partial [Ectocarpus sp. 12 AP-2014]